MIDFLLHGIKWAGGFSLARFLTRDRLRILCYHGVSVEDQHEFEPILFMRLGVFERRLDALADGGFPVIPLGEAVRRLAQGDINQCETVITIDDGWRSTFRYALPLLLQRGMPATLYVATYYMDNSVDVFNVAVRYILWRSGQIRFSLTGIHSSIDGDYDLGALGYEAVAGRIITCAEDCLSAPEKPKLLEAIATSLGMSIPVILGDERLRFMSRDEVAAASKMGIDVQLHTHRHRLPDSAEETRQEIELNRQMLEPIVGMRPTHFCYPSGMYTERHPAWLQECGIESATTCDPGHNRASAAPMLLKRFLDSDSTSEIRFQAEMAGVLEVFRSISKRFGVNPQ